jgi:hypothetical protein
MSQRQDLINQILAKYDGEEHDEETLEALEELTINDLEQLLNGVDEEQIF